MKKEYKSDEFYPDFYESMDRGSIDGQDKYVAAVQVQLGALLVAAIAGSFTLACKPGGFDFAGLLTVIAFVIALFARIRLLQTRPDKRWYGGRAAAESAKTLAWRFAVRAEPFNGPIPDHEAVNVFLSRLSEIRDKLGELSIKPHSSERGEVTEQMRALRISPLEARKSAYLDRRIQNQRTWYTNKAEDHANKSSCWTGAILAIECVGLIGAVLKTTGVVQVDLLAFASAIVAAIVAWTEMRQHDNQASAYSVAASELGSALTLGREVRDESSWAEFVANAEEAISREHTMWVASRGR